jgi:hypothetical protein
LVESPQVDLKYSLKALNAMGAGIVEATATQVSMCFQARASIWQAHDQHMIII